MEKTEEQRKGFVFLRSYYDALKGLSREDRALILDAVLQYVFEGKEPDSEALPPLLLGFFTLLRPNIDSSVRRYQTQRENGQKGGRPKKPNENTMLTHAEPNTKPKQNQDKDKDKDRDSIYSASPKEHPDFAVFWDAYPNKRNRPAARKAFAKIAGKVELSALLAALETQKRSPDWTKEAGKYIPYPASWLNGRRWEDEPQAAVVDPCVALPESVPDYGWGV